MGDVLLTIDQEELKSVIHKVVQRTMQTDYIWEWPGAVAFYGIGKAWECTGEPSYMDFLKNWVDTYMDIGIPGFMVNSVAMGHVLLFLHDYTDDKKYLDLAIEKAEFLEHKALRFGNRVLQHTVSDNDDFPGQAWADTLFMAAYFLLRLGKKINNESYVQDALHQYVMHEELLQDMKTDLFYHGYDEQTDSHMSGMLWARANGWAALTMAEAKGYINYLYPEFMAIDCSLRDQLSALMRLQSPNGLWHTLLDDPTSYEELSASSAIAAAMVINKHPLHRNAVLQAYHGVLEHIDERGSVLSVSAGTAVMKNAEDYKRVPNKRVQGWGQGLALSFLCALYKYIEEHKT